MPKALKLYIIGLVTTSAVALVVTSFVFAGRPDLIFGMRPGIALSQPVDAISVLAGLAFWTLVALAASAMPVRMPRGTRISVAMAPIVAAMVVGGPVAAGLVAAIGSTELRELRGRIPWYGTLSNHAGIVLPTIAGSFVFEMLLRLASDPLGNLLATLAGAAVLFSLNTVLATTAVSLLHGDDLRLVLMGDARAFAANNLALAPLAWLMAQVYELPGGWWTTLLFGLPLYTTRLASHRFVEMREMFTQTIGALAEAVDKRDPFTSRHSRRVMEISVDIGRVMRLNEAEMEAIEWGGLLHDVGKIGVPDHVLLKADKLTKDERAIMNAHPVLGAQIIAPVIKLAPELPIIRHHHEWYNGSGYPDRLIGEEIPKLARLLHVADAFEAMTAQRPYRMKPLSIEQALGELRKFAGVQFDPQVVDAFVRTKWVEGIPDPGRAVDIRPVPLLGHAAGGMTRVAALPDAGADPSDTR
jgi:HD-GYP domain-containing protein (c-di-GMP phosphodiesterase class II)